MRVSVSAICWSMRRLRSTRRRISRSRVTISSCDVCTAAAFVVDILSCLERGGEGRGGEGRGGEGRGGGGEEKCQMGPASVIESKEGSS